MYAALAARIVIFHRERAVHGLSLPVSVAVPEQGAGIPDPRADAHFRRGSAPGGGPADGLHVRRVNPAVNRGPAAGFRFKLVRVFSLVCPDYSCRSRFAGGAGRRVRAGVVFGPRKPHHVAHAERQRRGGIGGPPDVPGRPAGFVALPAVVSSVMS